MAASLLSCSRMTRWVHNGAAALLLTMLQVGGQSETSLGFFLIMYQYVRKCNEHLVSLIMFDCYLYLRREVCIRMIDVPGIHIPGTYHTTASAVCLHSLQSYRVFLILAAACCFSKFAPDRDSRVLVALYRCLPPNMVTAHFAPVFFFYSSEASF